MTISILEFIQIAKPSDQNYIDLKCGRDGFSNFNLQQLQEHISPFQDAFVSYSIKEESLRARCFRWICRGLTVSQAIKKIEIDTMIGQIYREKYYTEHPDPDAAHDLRKEGN